MNLWLPTINQFILNTASNTIHMLLFFFAATEPWLLQLHKIFV